jgi:hypothetical protein
MPGRATNEQQQQQQQQQNVQLIYCEVTQKPCFLLRTKFITNKQCVEYRIASHRITPVSRLTPATGRAGGQQHLRQRVVAAARRSAGAVAIERERERQQRQQRQPAGWHAAAAAVRSDDRDALAAAAATAAAASYSADSLLVSRFSIERTRLVGMQLFLYMNRFPCLFDRHLPPSTNAPNAANPLRVLSGGQRPSSPGVKRHKNDIFLFSRIS